jgi:hypothetical protein
VQLYWTLLALKDWINADYAACSIMAEPIANVAESLGGGQMSDDTRFEELLIRLSEGVIENERKLVFLFGAALTSYPGGVDGVAGINRRVVTRLREIRSRKDSVSKFFDELNREDLSDAQHYQRLVDKLNATLTPDAFKRIVQAACLEAYKGRIGYSAKDVNDALCARCENDLDGWEISPALKSLAQLIRHYPDYFHPVVLTTNFDPLIEIALRRAGLPTQSFGAEVDGFSQQSDAQGATVIHLHGSWRGTKLLSTSKEINKIRPKVTRDLAALIREYTVVTMAYGGWDDIFLKELIAMIHHEFNAKGHVFWTAYGKQLPDTLPAETRREIDEDDFFPTIDCHRFLPALLKEWEQLHARQTPLEMYGQLLAIDDDLVLSYSDLPVNLNAHWGLERGGFLASLIGGDTDDIEDMLLEVERLLSVAQTESAHLLAPLPSRHWQRVDLCAATAAPSQVLRPVSTEGSRGLLLSLSSNGARNLGGALAARDIALGFLAAFLRNPTDGHVGDALILHLSDQGVEALGTQIVEEWRQREPDMEFERLRYLRKSATTNEPPVLDESSHPDWPAFGHLPLAGMVRACLEEVKERPDSLDRELEEGLLAFQERLEAAPMDASPPVSAASDAVPEVELAESFSRWLDLVPDRRLGLTDLRAALILFHRRWPEAARATMRASGRLAPAATQLELLNAIADSPDLVANWLLGFQQRDGARLQPSSAIHRAVSRRSPGDALRIALLQVIDLDPGSKLAAWAAEQLMAAEVGDGIPSPNFPVDGWEHLFRRALPATNSAQQRPPDTGGLNQAWLHGLGAGGKASSERAWLTGALHPGLLADVCGIGTEYEHLWWYCALFPVDRGLLDTLLGPRCTSVRARAVFGLLTPDERCTLVKDAQLADQIRACRRGRSLHQMS